MLGYVSVSSAVAIISRLGVALPIAILFGGLWHLARTWAWAQCFPQARPVSFLRLARIRLYAEAFSYLTVRGIAGEPLKVVLLADAIDPREVTAALALERIGYLVGTTMIVGATSLLAIIMMPLTSGWLRVFSAFAIVSCTIAALSVTVVTGRGIYVQGLLRRLDRAATTSFSDSVVGRFLTVVERHMLELVRGNPRRLAVLAIATVCAFASMVLEAWVLLAAWGTPVTATGAFAVEGFSRVASFATAFIPANLGALEASSRAAWTLTAAAFPNSRLNSGAYVNWGQRSDSLPTFKAFGSSIAAVAASRRLVDRPIAYRLPTIALRRRVARPSACPRRCDHLGLSRR